MRKFVLLAILLVAISVSITFQQAQAEGENKVYLPLILSPIMEFNPYPDGDFPGTPVRITGPKIVETWSGPWAQCRIFKLDSGSTFDWPYNGHIFSFQTQAELNQRYTSHRDAFLTKAGNENCLEGIPVAPPMPTATSTHEPTATPLPTVTLMPTATPVPTLVPPTEGEFPGTTGDFSIIEWWDGGTNCGIFMSDSPYSYDRFGHFWSYSSAVQRDIIYPAHLASFLNKPENANCIEGQP